MPFTWTITIPKSSGLASFDPPTQNMQVGDQIFWRNDDTKAHYPHPNADFVFMANQIAPNSTSPGFAPGTPGTITYHCCLHPGETGTIEVQAPPA